MAENREASGKRQSTGLWMAGPKGLCKSRRASSDPFSKNPPYPNHPHDSDTEAFPAQKQGR